MSNRQSNRGRKSSEAVVDAWDSDVSNLRKGWAQRPNV
ncbi:uncharacterized protein METZ01_LOCUS449107 [marine metagenome]|uniref:Uncharacterized protein n=1 Tax=marine metagenome TaxID=408172 RepID=A0A382ZLE2_9ZZZZ